MRLVVWLTCLPSMKSVGANLMPRFAPSPAAAFCSAGPCSRAHRKSRLSSSPSYFAHFGTSSLVA